MGPMSGTITIFMLGGLLLLSTACTTTRPVYNIDEKTYASQIDPGDRIRITYLDDRVKEIDVSEINDTEIKGALRKNTLNQPRGTEIVADWQDLYAVERVRVSALKTAGAAVGVVIVIPVLAILALLSGAYGY